MAQTKDNASLNAAEIELINGALSAMVKSCDRQIASKKGTAIAKAYEAEKVNYVALQMKLMGQTNAPF